MTLIKTTGLSLKIFYCRCPGEISKTYVFDYISKRKVDINYDFFKQLNKVKKTKTQIQMYAYLY